MITREKIIKTTTPIYTETGYVDGYGDFITHSFDDEPARIFNSGTKIWFKDNDWYRDNHKPAIVRSNGNCEYYNNENRYWFINGTEYHSYEEVEEKFKNNILKLKNINTNILKENNIDAIWLYSHNYLIQDQSQCNLAILKFL